MEDGKFKKLDDLLKQSELYTTFLVENIKEYEQQRANEAEGAQSQDDEAGGDDEQDNKTGKGTKKGGKRKAAAKGGRAAKRSKKTDGRKRVSTPRDRANAQCVCTPTCRVLVTLLCWSRLIRSALHTQDL